MEKICFNNSEKRKKKIFFSRGLNFANCLTVDFLRGFNFPNLLKICENRENLSRKQSIEKITSHARTK